MAHEDPPGLAREPSGEQEDSGEFLYLKLDGERFMAKGMPAEAAVELKAVRDVVFRLARKAWLAAHDTYQRVPAGFEAMVDLRLVSIDEGSAVPVLQLHVPSTYDEDLDPHAMLPAIRAGRDSLLDVLEHAHEDLTLPHALADPETAHLLARLGSSLSPSESLSLGPARPAGRRAAPDRLVTLDHSTRATLAAIDEALREATEPTELTQDGIITELDGTNHTFRLKTGRGFVDCKLAQGEFALGHAIRDVLAGDGVTAPDVRVRGWGVPEPNGRVRWLSDVTEVDITRTLEEKHLMARLDYLADLPPGWQGTGSQSPTTDAVATARTVLGPIAHQDPRPDLVARPDGSLAFSVEHDELALMAIIESDGRSMYLWADNDVDDPDDLEAAFDATQFVTFLATGQIA